MQGVRTGRNNQKQKSSQAVMSFVTWSLIKLESTHISVAKGGGFVGQYKNYYINHWSETSFQTLKDKSDREGKDKATERLFIFAFFAFIYLTFI